MANVVNPPNPYVAPFKVFPGTMVKFTGQPRPNAQRFAINFQTGPSLNPRDDLALHLSPCFNPPRIVRNSLRHGAWGTEEAWSNGQTMLHNQPFEIIILALADKFKIAVNGTHYAEFNHRIPYAEISHLTIDGDVDISAINISSQPASNYSSVQNQHGRPASAPYPTEPAGMPMPNAPQLYPSLPGYPPQQPGPYPMAASGPPPAYPSGPTGPVPVGASYSSGPPHGHPMQQPMQQPPYGYPPAGPTPTGAQYQGYYQNQPHQPYQTQQPYQPHQPQQPHASSSPFSSLPIGGKALGTIAGLGLGAAAGAAVLSAVNPVKHVKKLCKPKGWGRSSSSSSSSSSSRSSSSSD